MCERESSSEQSWVLKRYSFLVLKNVAGLILSILIVVQCISLQFYYSYYFYYSHYFIVVSIIIIIIIIISAYIIVFIIIYSFPVLAPLRQ